MHRDYGQMCVCVCVCVQLTWVTAWALVCVCTSVAWGVGCRVRPMLYITCRLSSFLFVTCRRISAATRWCQLGCRYHGHAIFDGVGSSGWAWQVWAHGRWEGLGAWLLTMIEFIGRSMYVRTHNGRISSLHMVPFRPSIASPRHAGRAVGSAGGKAATAGYGTL